MKIPAGLARVLIVAGSDSGGGAGIQADIKAVTALGGYASTAITALTAQNTLGVHGIHDIAPAFIAEQMEVVLDDIGADCLKTGMLYTADVIEAVCTVIDDKAADVPVVIDPVMVAKGGALLLDTSAIAAVVENMIPRAHIVTPNAPEAAALVGCDIVTKNDLVSAADRLLALGARAVLVKGGHLAGDVVVDVLAEAGGEKQVFEAPRINTPHTHGTGCTLASAIATGIGQGMALVEAVARARDYVRLAIARAPGIGRGHGPLNHMVTINDFGRGREGPSK